MLSDTFCTHRYILDDVDRHWSYHDKDNDGFISLQEYKDTSYGVIEGELAGAIGGCDLSMMWVWFLCRQREHI